MGIFILDRGRESEGAVARLCGAGFGLDRQIRLPGARLTLLRKLNGAPVAFLAMENGDWASHTGTLLTGQEVGEAALRHLYARIDGSDPWEGTRGHFCALVWKGGALHVLADRLNVNKIYAGGRVLSNSFVALVEAGAARAVDGQGVHEYVWNGAPFGTRTLFTGISSLPNNAVATLRGGSVEIIRREWRPAAPPLDVSGDLDAIAWRCLDRLRPLFGAYAHQWPRQVRSALSGGFDSRLLLAAMLETGMQPRLFVYGPPHDPDVKVAQAICAGEGLELEHIDKRSTRPLAPARVAEAYLAFDGWKNDGLFDGGADLADRLARSGGGQVLMNGSVGEIFRNFFYLRDGRFSLRDVVWCFYSRLDPSACAPGFHRRSYEDGVIAAMEDATGLPGGRALEREAVERLYPFFRGRYWTARDVALNQRFGATLYPFLEPEAFEGTWAVPLRFKTLGALEARMIALLSPRLAAYGSVYGRDFTGPIPAGARLRAWLDNHRPPRLRRETYRLKALEGRALPGFLSADSLRGVMDSSFPYMRRLFRPERIRDPDVFNRLATVEYLCQRSGAAQG